MPKLQDQNAQKAAMAQGYKPSRKLKKRTSGGGNPMQTNPTQQSQQIYKSSSNFNV